MDAMARFFAKVEIGDCWLWTAYRCPKGYGRFQAGSSRQAHRWLWEQLVGDIPAPLELDHLCRIRHCVNPDHLEPVTHEENVRRSRAAHAGAMRLYGQRTPERTHCKWGHEFTEENTVIYSGRRFCRYCNNRTHVTADRRTREWA